MLTNDINVRFWNIKNEEVITRYLISRFLRCTRIFLKHSKIYWKSNRKVTANILDGPNVNWAFIKEYKSEFLNNKLFDIGSCLILEF